MGKINQPTTTIQKTVVSSDDPHSVINDDDTEINFIDEAQEGDNFSLTNESIRLIGLKHQLDIDATNTDHDQELKHILEWAKQAGIRNKNQLSAKLREIQYKLGYSEPKQAIKNIYNYIRLESQIRSLVNQQEILHAKRN
jgi:hypothetical protein